MHTKTSIMLYITISIVILIYSTRPPLKGHRFREKQRLALAKPGTTDPQLFHHVASAIKLSEVGVGRFLFVICITQFKLLTCDEKS